MLDSLLFNPWQMTLGERVALEGIVSQVRPTLAIEIGTAEGGSLRRVAAHSEHVHSFDLVEPDASVKELPNVTFHTGDGHVLLPEALAAFADEGRNVDFVLVDGDHSAEGVRADVEDLRASPAIGRTVIVIHDTLNDVVRAGLEAVEWDSWDGLTYVDLDLIAGHLSRSGPYRNHLWGGLGIAIVGDGPRRPASDEYFDPPEVFGAIRDRLVASGGPESAGSLESLLDPPAQPADPAAPVAARQPNGGGLLGRAARALRR